VIEKKTGFKTVCPKELGAFMQKLWLKQGRGDPKHEYQVTIRNFLDEICRQLSLKWDFDPASNTVALSLSWKTEDSRSPAELLDFVRKPAVDLEKNEKWQEAFNALLSCSVNFDRAWRVRQQSEIEELFRIYPGGFPLLIRPIISTDLQKYIFVLIRQPIETYPGHGSASYYWFKEDGALIGAGLIDTGHRCALLDAAVDNEADRLDKASEIHMILKMNLRNFFVARFVLEKTGLKLISLVNVYGEAVNNDGLNVGQSLLKE